MNSLCEENLVLYQSLFRGREDLYAKHWESNGRGGYSPGYKFDWNEFMAYKAKGGTMKDFQNKELLPLTQAVLQNHLEGSWRIGIYPLLDDNTSYFIAADFDKENWKDECLAFLKVCEEFQIPAYLERSGSGNGGHVWIFFEEAYPSVQSRKIILELIRKSQNISVFEKEVSFDRLFPSQDFHSKQGYGNLIALPLHGKRLEDGNTAFLDQKTFTPYPDQWKFLSQVKRISTDTLDQLHDYFNEAENILDFTTYAKQIPSKPKTSPKEKCLHIYIQNQIYLEKSELNGKLVRFLREHLNFLNSEYLTKKKFGKSVYKTEKYFNCITEEDNKILIPRGFVNELLDFCKEENIAYKIVDDRKKQKAIAFKSHIQLRDYQEEALDVTEDKDFGVLVAPPGAGKTIMGLELIIRKEQPALILVHRKQLLDQWIDRIQSFLKIPKKDIGQISGYKKKVGKKITIAMMQTLSRMEETDLEPLKNAFGTIIVDECHHIPAKTFREVITDFNSYYLYGLTATPKRKHNDEKLIFVYIGNILHEVDLTTQDNTNQKLDPHVRIKETNLKIPFEAEIESRQTLLKILTFDTNRNQMIVEDVLEQVEQNKKILVLTERKDHVETLNLYLKDKCEVITITGEDPISAKKSKKAQIDMGHFQVLISTGQFFGEGMDVPHLDCLFLVYPFSFEGKLIQYIGRIQRSDSAKMIFDYRDRHVPYFDRMFKQRNRYYKKLSNNNPTLGI